MRQWETWPQAQTCLLPFHLGLGDISPYEEIEASSLARLVEEGRCLVAISGIVIGSRTITSGKNPQPAFTDYNIGGHGHLDENVEHAPPISVFGNDYDQMPPEISPHGKMDLTLTHMLVRRIPPQLPLLRRFIGARYRSGNRRCYVTSHFQASPEANQGHYGV